MLAKGFLLDITQQQQQQQQQQKESKWIFFSFIAALKREKINCEIYLSSTHSQFIF